VEGGILLAVESKTSSAALETSIGPRMARYVANLIESPPTIHRVANDPWMLVGPESNVKLAPVRAIRSAGAFVWSGEEQLTSALERGELDLVIGVEFFPDKQIALLHLRARTGLEMVVTEIVRLAGRIIGIEIQEH
jgi:hypothetical protein